MSDCIYLIIGFVIGQILGTIFLCLVYYLMDYRRHLEHDKTIKIITEAEERNGE